MSVVPRPPYQQELFVGRKLPTGQMAVQEVRVLDWDGHWWSVTQAGWEKLEVQPQKLLNSGSESGNLGCEGGRNDSVASGCEPVSTGEQGTETRAEAPEAS